MKYLLKRDRKFREYVSAKSYSRHSLKAALSTVKFYKKIRQLWNYFLQKFRKRYFFTKCYGRCFINGSSKSINIFFRVSRFTLKHFVPFGKLYGLAGVTSLKK
jgi:hypothetical protein